MNTEERGFCTIATGDIKYSKLAQNLFLSYVRHTSCKYPFTVFTDRSNKYLECFDNIVVWENPYKTFLDKLNIFSNPPYKETIFVDADSLVYGDLSQLFNYFKDADSVSCVGKVLPLSSKEGWFRVEDTLYFKNRLNYTLWLHGGIYYFQQTKQTKQFFDLCLEIIPLYKDIFFRFQYLTEPADEPIVALAMAIMGFKTINYDPDIFAFYRDSNILKADIVTGSLIYEVSSGKSKHGILIHWATDNTEKSLYKIEAEKLQYMQNHSRFSSIMRVCYKMKYEFMRIMERIRILYQ